MNTRTLGPMIAVVIALILSSSWAQGGFFGVNAGVLLTPPAVTLGLQGGATIEDNFDIRFLADVMRDPIATDPLIMARFALDALYTVEIPEAPVTVYIGGGMGVLQTFGCLPRHWFCYPVLPEAHATVGAEYRVAEEVGLFVEAQLILIVPIVRAGANFHF